MIDVKDFPLPNPDLMEVLVSPRFSLATRQIPLLTEELRRNGVKEEWIDGLMWHIAKGHRFISPEIVRDEIDSALRGLEFGFPVIPFEKMEQCRLEKLKRIDRGSPGNPNWK